MTKSTDVALMWFLLETVGLADCAPNRPGKSWLNVQDVFGLLLVQTLMQLIKPL